MSIRRVLIKTRGQRRRGPQQPAFLVFAGEVSIRVRRRDGHWDDYGVVSRKTVTLAAIAELLAVLAGGSSTSLGDFKHHALGNGTSPESAADTALESEVGTRHAGSQAAVGANQYVTEATFTADFSDNVTEHGVFSAANVLLDRSRTVPVLIDEGDQVVSTYKLTLLGS